MVNRTFEEIIDMITLIVEMDGEISLMEFICDFYHLEDLRSYFEKEKDRYSEEGDYYPDMKLYVQNVRYMFKRIKIINPKQWRKLKSATAYLTR